MTGARHLPVMGMRASSSHRRKQRVRPMTETQGDYLGCLIVLIGIIPLLISVHVAGKPNRRRASVNRWIAISGVFSVIGVAVVVLS